MSLRFLTAALLTVQLMLLIAALMVLLTFAMQVVQGGPFVTSWPVAAETSIATFPLSGGEGAIRIDKGVLTIDGTDWKAEFVQLILFGLVVTGAYFGIERLKLIVAAIAARKPFRGEVVRGLRVIGYLMLGWMALDFIEAFVIQPALIEALAPSGRSIAVHGLPWAHSNDAERSFHVTPDLDLLKIIAGLFALAMAHAFAIGGALAEENEAIV